MINYINGTISMEIQTDDMDTMTPERLEIIHIDLDEAIKCLESIQRLIDNRRLH